MDAKDKDEGFSLLTVVLVGVGALGVGVAAGYVIRDMEEPEQTAAKK